MTDDRRQAVLKCLENFLFTVSSDSAKYSLLSECPIITYLTPASVKHIRSNLSGIGAFFFVVHILCTYCNIRSLTCLRYRDDIDSRYAEDNVRLIQKQPAVLMY